MHIWLSQSLDISKFNCLHIPSWTDSWFASKIFWWAAFIHNVCVFNRNPISLVHPVNRRISGVESHFWFVPNLKARTVCVEIMKKSSAFSKIILRKFTPAPQNIGKTPDFRQFYPINFFKIIFYFFVLGSKSDSDFTKKPILFCHAIRFFVQKRAIRFVSFTI